MITHEIIQVPEPGSPDRQALYDLCISARIEVFVKEQGFPLEVEVEEADSIATHFLLRHVSSGRHLGTVRIHKPQGVNYYKVARLVIIKEYRRHGLGASLVKKAHQWAWEDHAKSGRADPVNIVAHSQIHAMPFYTSLGYIPEGETFDEDGEPHQKMVARISTHDP